LSDVQAGGLTFVTSGTYDRAAVIEGDWALAQASVFIGNTQKGNPFSANSGPFQSDKSATDGSLSCDGGKSPPSYCLSKQEGVSFPLSNWGVSQRLFSIYDGPAYEDSNAYLDITTAPCNDCVYGRTLGVRKEAKDDKKCYLPNAAIGWKQPNGFFYPPSFHSTNLFFDKVDIRHYVIDALFKPNTYIDSAQVKDDYCNVTGGGNTYAPFFTNFTDIDRQTELNDDDGSLTGLMGQSKNGDTLLPPGETISVNPVAFFDAPVETAECLSNLGVTADKACPAKKGDPLPATPTPAGAKTSPYDYVTTVIFPECGVGLPPDHPNPGRCGDDKIDHNVGDRYDQQVGRAGTWSRECTNPSCYGVPLYRQFLTGADKNDREAKTWYDLKCDVDKTQEACRWPFVRMGGQSTYQRSTLTANHGTYYVDTSVSRDQQWKKEKFSDIIPCDVKETGPCQQRSVNVFEGGKTYYMFFLYAKQSTQQTYQIYVGPGFNVKTDVKAVRAYLNTLPVERFDNATWPAAWGDPHYNDEVACANSVPKTNCYILQVTIDMKGQTDLNTSPDNPSLCLPHKFCKQTGSTCGCALAADDPLIKANPGMADVGDKPGLCTLACSEWSVKDLDFPSTGPLGFAFKLPSNPKFIPDDQSLSHRPFPTLFPTKPDSGKPDWLTTFIRTSTLPDKESGACYYSKIPGAADCKIP
jgi:cell migration-inducing and hyaluronan-binding protein